MSDDYKPDNLDDDIKKEKEDYIKKQRLQKYGNNVCPLCSGALIKRNGCQVCASCGYEKCDI